MDAFTGFMHDANQTQVRCVPLSKLYEILACFLEMFMFSPALLNDVPHRAVKLQFL